jgi:uncharacterized membrane protein YdjX (TVP38/TMEM64 family)
VRPRTKWAIGIGILLGTGIILVMGVHLDMEARVRALVRSVADPTRFTILMAILPAVGAPISPFLVSAGAVFGAGLGLAVAMLTMPVHLGVAILAARLIRDPIRRFLDRRDIRIPSVDDDREVLYSVIFLATPGPPYAAKNLLLPLAGFRFRHCFFTNWLVQGLLCLPLVVMGSSAVEGRFGLVAGAAAALLLIIVLGRSLRKRYPDIRKALKGRNAGEGKNPTPLEAEKTPKQFDGSH